jgi:hypothetical protein
MSFAAQRGKTFATKWCQKASVRRRSSDVASKIILLAAVLAAGCAGTTKDISVLDNNDAIDDYIQVADLKETDAIRYFRRLDHKVINKKYAIFSVGSNSYLATYVDNCQSVNDRDVRPDIRYDNHVLRARSDTYRGCRIKALYELDKGQVKELIDLGKEPGEKNQ